MKDPPPRDATTSDAAADRRIAPRSTGNGRTHGGQGKGRVGFQAWAAHLEGAEAGGDSVHGRRFLWPSGSMESSPAARRRRGMQKPGWRWRQAVRQVDGNESSSHSREGGVCAYRSREAAHVWPAHSLWA